MPSELARLELTATVHGLGLWTPRHPDVGHFLGARAVAPDAAQPDASLIPSRQRRRTTLLARMAADAMRQACAQAAMDVATLETVFASMLGEVDAAATLIEMMTTSGIMSPTRFQNSVHNAASGLISIATGNSALTTSVAAGWDLVAMALLEGTALCNARGTDVVVVVEEEPWPDFVDHDRFEPACVAIALRGPQHTDGAIATLSTLRRVPHTEAPAAPRLDAHLRNSPVAPAFDLVRALADAAPGRRTAALEPVDGDAPVWVIDIVPGAGVAP